MSWHQTACRTVPVTSTAPPEAPSLLGLTCADTTAARAGRVAAVLVATRPNMAQATVANSVASSFMAPGPQPWGHHISPVGHAERCPADRPTFVDDYGRLGPGGKQPRGPRPGRLCELTWGRMAASQGFGSWRHLAGRFFWALSPAGPPPEDEAWALGSLLDGEKLLWHRMSGPDQRHAVGVARDTVRFLEPDEAPPEVVAAALLHDVGKVEAQLGTFARVGVTLAALAVGRARLLHWACSGPPAAVPSPSGASTPSGPLRSSRRARVGMYLTHDALGAQLLRQASSRELTISWAREHHLEPARWTVDARVGAALKAADGD